MYTVLNIFTLTCFCTHFYQQFCKHFLQCIPLKSSLSQTFTGNFANNWASYVFTLQTASYTIYYLHKPYTCFWGIANSADISATAMTTMADRWSVGRSLKASFWGLFKTNFYGHFRKLFLFTKFNFLNFGKKFFLTILKSTCLEFYASNYVETLLHIN